MKNGIIPVFSLLKVIAILGILICHYLFNWYMTLGIGRFFGCTFNALFIGLSGLLLGMKWHSCGRKKLTLGFLRHRFAKLMRTYYPFLLLMFLFLTYIYNYTLNLKDIALYLVFLPWIDRLPEFEHLWFMTMIAVCYVSIYFLTQLNFVEGSKMKYVAITASICAIHALLLTKGLPGQLFLYLWFFILCFYHANDIRLWCEHTMSKNSYYIIILGIIIIVFIFHLGLYDSNRLIGEWFGVLAAALVAKIILSVYKNAKNNKIISFLADISFEIYLVHHVIAFGKWSIISYVGNPFLGFVAYVLCSILMAYVLRKASYVIYNMINLTNFNLK